MRAMSSFQTVCALAGICLVGCGGLDGNDMRKYAIKRGGGDDETPNPAPSRPAAATTAPVESKKSPSELTERTTPDAAVSSLSSTKHSPSVAPAAGMKLANTPALAPTPVRNSEPLSDEDRRLRTIENLRVIGEALERHIKTKNCYPAPAIVDGAGQAILSWRVTLLPYLGYEDLFKQFRLNEAWDSPHNRQLLGNIPAEYQSPERFDVRTNYLACTGSSAAFPGPNGLPLGRFEDGVTETVILVEANDSLAAPWTKPAEYTVGRQPRANLGELRADGFYVIFGGGYVRRVPPDIPESLVRAIMTIDGGEGPVSAQASRDPDLEALMTESQDLIPGNEIGKGSVQSAPTESRSSSAILAAKTVAPSRDTTKSDEPRIAVPPEEALLAKRTQLRELYKPVASAASTIALKREFLQRILRDSAEALGEPATHYSLLQAALAIAIQTGDFATTKQIIDDLGATYKLDVTYLQYTSFMRLARSKHQGEFQAKLIQESNDISKSLADAERYALAADFELLAINLAKRTGNRKLLSDLTQRHHDLLESQSLYEASQIALRTLNSEQHDARANHNLGKYLCFVKTDWENGLPILTQGMDPLRSLAEREVANPANPEEQHALADDWWLQADRAESVERRAMHLRALHWYEHCLPRLAPGLSRVQTQTRIEQISRFYGLQ